RVARRRRGGPGAEGFRAPSPRSPAVALSDHPGAPTSVFSKGCRRSPGRPNTLSQGPSRSPLGRDHRLACQLPAVAVSFDVSKCSQFVQPRDGVVRCGLCADRKSTRLNSSHVKISYAVFCLKKKKKHVTIVYWTY